MEEMKLSMLSELIFSYEHDTSNKTTLNIANVFFISFV